MQRNFILALGLLTLAACTAAPSPTPPRGTPTRGAGGRQTVTAIPSTAPTASGVPAPTNLVNPTSTRVAAAPSPILPAGRLPLPTGVPVASWHDFPIMPNAIAGQDSDKGGYSYSIKASPQQIQEFYTREMKKLGWDLLTTGTKADDRGYLLLVYFQANYPTFTVLVSVQSDVTAVFIAN